VVYDVRDPEQSEVPLKPVPKEGFRGELGFFSLNPLSFAIEPRFSSKVYQLEEGLKSVTSIEDQGVIEGPEEGPKAESEEGQGFEPKVENEEGQGSERKAESEEGQRSERKAESEEGQGSKHKAESEEGQGSERKAESEEGQGSECKAESEEGQGSERKAESEEGQGSERKAESEEGEGSEKEIKEVERPAWKRGWGADYRAFCKSREDHYNSEETSKYVGHSTHCEVFNL
jgi:hypothetical protein